MMILLLLLLQKEMVSGEIFQDTDENFNTEVLPGGYHGKVKMIFVAVPIMRFKTENKNPKTIKLQIGEVDISKDMNEVLHFIVEKLTPGIKNQSNQGWQGIA